MEINEIKKSLYKEKPIATRTSYQGKYVHYVTQISNCSVVEFEIPIDEANFDNEVPAQLLIRWLKKI